MSEEINTPLPEKYSAAVNNSLISIRDIRVRAALPALPVPLATASGQLTHAPVVLVDIHMTGGVTGHSYLFSPRADMLRPLIAVVSALAETLKGQPCDPIAISAVMDRQFLLFGGTGLVTMARAGIDMALWDALAKECKEPLGRLLGGTLDPVPAYESSGLGLSSPSELAGESARYLSRGFRTMKLRLGYETLAEDLRAVEAVRDVIGPDNKLMVDYNQSLNEEEALKRCRALEPFDLLWIEEPLPAANLEGSARLSQAIQTPIQIGENLFNATEVKRAIDLRASRYLMPDVMKIGGVTHWMSAAQQTDRAGIPVSSHLFPEISAHLLSATPNRHFLEYANWADAILQTPVEPVNGMVTPSNAPGAGIAWDEAALAKVELKF